MAFLAAIMIIVHLSSQMCSGMPEHAVIRAVDRADTNYGRYSCGDCIIGRAADDSSVMFSQSRRRPLLVESAY